MNIIDQVIEMMVKIENVGFSQAGCLKSEGDLAPVQSNDYIPTIDVDVELFDSRFPLDTPDTDPDRLRDRQGSDIQKFMRSLLEGWIEYDRASTAYDFKRMFNDYDYATEWDDKYSVLVPRFTRLLLMLADLDARSAFKDQDIPIILHHPELEPRNIMVENSRGAWKISGIIDWNEAEALPKPLARRPPAWIWSSSDELSKFHGSDEYVIQEVDKDSRTLKAYFDATVERALPGYCEDAYGYGRWFRRIFAFARSGLNESRLMGYLDKLLDAWKTDHKLFRSLEVTS